MIPIVVRSAEEMLKLVPHDLREAAYALGVPKWKTIVKVVLPTALAGIITGITLAIARVIGETAPLLIICGVDRLGEHQPVQRTRWRASRSSSTSATPSPGPTPTSGRTWPGARPWS